jgi:membrane-associated phospholipid phosphatase
MQHRSRFIAIASLACAASTTPAQPVGRMFGDDMKHLGGDVAAIWASPVRASSRDWLSTAGAAGAFGAAMLADRPVAQWAARNEHSGFFDALAPVRESGVGYSAKLLAPPLASLYAAGLVLRRTDLREAATGCLGAWFSQSMMRQVTYRLVARARPDTSPDDPERWGIPGSRNWELQSFPAGHIANAMACSSFWSNRYHLGYAEPALYAFAAVVGLGRIADAGHWISDSVIGGIIGYATGRELARRSLARRARGAARQGDGLLASPSSPLGRVSFTISF